MTSGYYWLVGTLCFMITLKHKASKAPNKSWCLCKSYWQCFSPKIACYIEETHKLSKSTQFCIKNSTKHRTKLFIDIKNKILLIEIGYTTKKSFTNFMFMFNLISTKNNSFDYFAKYSVIEI